MRRWQGIPGSGLCAGDLIRPRAIKRSEVLSALAKQEPKGQHVSAYQSLGENAWQIMSLPSNILKWGDGQLIP